MARTRKNLASDKNKKLDISDTDLELLELPMSNYRDADSRQGIQSLYLRWRRKQLLALANGLPGDFSG
jgi:hypothetical protein